MRTLQLAALTLLFVAVSLACSGSSEVENNPALVQRMQYLTDLAEIDWVDFEGGNIYVGFNRKTGELPNIVNTAVAIAHKTHGKKVHLYAVDGGQPGWRLGDGPLFCEARMNMGSLQQACM
jgi:hypothetical protein